ncbi:MAG: bifunctional glutamate N-acetyltransferase/amino-acid acetyltransferase ArgJ [Bryobacteraceae bacterium]|nr:bifunctional glutamate N-acetyltransferase/amino-acid acetyltransferase ArgJ [Bryobacteraceae bacterium]
MPLPLGFHYSAVYAGVRKDPRPDLALIAAAEAVPVAGVFTTNRVQAAPVKLSKRHLEGSGGRARAFLINAGNANCATRTGDRVALDTCRATARELGCPALHVLPSSTGVIGVEMDGGKIEGALPALVAGLSPDRFDDVAAAIMTTDLRPKTSHLEVKLSGGTVRISGMTKGSGMIQPNMATTLGYVMTDAQIGPRALKMMLVRATEISYHRLTVDGDTSTNDTVLLAASGASKVKASGADAPKFEEALGAVMESLAKQIARDGEGAKKLITIDVEGAPDDAAAAKIARSIANSPLVKTAIAGSDPNWGRILGAAGYAGVPFDPGRADIWVQGVQVCKNGLAADFSESELKNLLDGDECAIRLALKTRGVGRARFYTCDFTHGYIDINASYRT